MRVLLAGLILSAIAWSAPDTTELRSLKGAVHLTGSQSPYIIQRSLVQESGDSLFVDPGVNVIVAGYHKVMLQGAVRIQGTVRNPVRFTSLDSSDTWNGFHIATGSSPVSIQGLIVENAFRNTFNGVIGTMQGTRFIHNYYGLWIDNSPSLLMSNCDIRLNRYGISGVRGDISLNKSKIQENIHGIWLESAVSVQGKDNLITTNISVDISLPTDSARQSASDRYSRAVLQGIEARF